MSSKHVSNCRQVEGKVGDQKQITDTDYSTNKGTVNTKETLQTVPTYAKSTFACSGLCSTGLSVTSLRVPGFSIASLSVMV